MEQADARSPAPQSAPGPTTAPAPPQRNRKSTSPFHPRHSPPPPPPPDAPRLVDRPTTLPANLPPPPAVLIILVHHGPPPPRPTRPPPPAAPLPPPAPHRPTAHPPNFLQALFHTLLRPALRPRGYSPGDHHGVCNGLLRRLMVAPALATLYRTALGRHRRRPASPAGGEDHRASQCDLGRLRPPPPPILWAPHYPPKRLPCECAHRVRVLNVAL